MDKEKELLWNCYIASLELSIFDEVNKIPNFIPIYYNFINYLSVNNISWTCISKPQKEVLTYKLDNNRMDEIFNENKGKSLKVFSLTVLPLDLHNEGDSSFIARMYFTEE